MVKRELQPVELAASFCPICIRPCIRPVADLSITWGVSFSHLSLIILLCLALLVVVVVVVVVELLGSSKVKETHDLCRCRRMSTLAHKVKSCDYKIKLNESFRVGLVTIKLIVNKLNLIDNFQFNVNPLVELINSTCGLTLIDSF